MKSSDKPQVDALKASITDLQDAVTNLSGLSGIGTVTSAAGKVATNAGNLVDSLQAGCSDA